MSLTLDVGAGSAQPRLYKDGSGGHSQGVVLEGVDGNPAGGAFIVPTALTLTRPGSGDTNQYAAKDVIADKTSSPTLAWFTGVVAAVGRSGRITKVRVNTSQTTCTARLRLHFFHTAPTQIIDNGPFTALDADFTKKVGHIDLPPLATEGSGSDVATAMNNWDVLPFKCAAASQDLYYMLETLDAFTPASAQTFKLEITVEPR